MRCSHVFRRSGEVRMLRLQGGRARWRVNGTSCCQKTETQGAGHGRATYPADPVRPAAGVYPGEVAIPPDKRGQEAPSCRGGSSSSLGDAFGYLWILGKVREFSQ